MVILALLRRVPDNLNSKSVYIGICQIYLVFVRLDKIELIRAISDFVSDPFFISP